MKSAVRLRVSVVALVVDAGDVLLIHQVTHPEPNCWDLPGGGLEPQETLIEGLRREVAEETGLQGFQVDRLLTVTESFYQVAPDDMLHTLNVIYQCSISERPIHLSSLDPEVGEQGVQWLPIDTLTADQCSTRTWKALQAANLVTG